MTTIADTSVVEPAMASGNRWQARLALGFADDHGTTRLVHRSHCGPLVVQKPLYPEGGKVCHAIIVHPPGGVVGGDQLTITTQVQHAAHAFVTTPGAAKWYRANGQSSRQTVQLQAEAGAALEWLPQETIFFNGANVQLDQDIVLADDACYIGWEVLCFGRTASGERFDAGRVAQRTSIRRAGKLIWHEQGSIAGGAPMHSPLALAGYTVCATLLAVGAAIPPALLQMIPEQATGIIDKRGKLGASQVKQVCVVRYLGHSSELAKQVMACAWQILRPTLLQRDAISPRIWQT